MERIPTQLEYESESATNNPPERPAQGKAAVTLADYPDVGRVDQVAAICDCSKWTVYSMIEAGQLRAVRLGRAIRVTRAALEEFLELTGANRDGQCA